MGIWEKKKIHGTYCLKLKACGTMYFRPNQNLEVKVFVEDGTLENPEKYPQSKVENQQQTQPTCDAGSGN